MEWRKIDETLIGAAGRQVEVKQTAYLGARWYKRAWRHIRKARRLITTHTDESLLILTTPKTYSAGVKIGTPIKVVFYALEDESTGKDGEGLGHWELERAVGEHGKGGTEL